MLTLIHSCGLRLLQRASAYLEGLSTTEDQNLSLVGLQAQHWTADRRRRHGLDAPEHCFLCDQDEETINHIIVVCPFTREVWFFVLEALGL